ncbi:MAG: zf-TFIIB domain-containing protein [Candidatus Melainabacteria bacterium]|nr:zf-TFIIB domain-containing protein [Candidatus Melainabacteria bacterium]
MTSSCPVCREATLIKTELEADLSARQCTECGGTYISANDYDHWLSRSEENLPEKPDQGTISLVSGEAAGPRFCPDCKFVLIKYKIGHGTGFAINKCGNCGGMWLDQNEWQILKARNLHDDLHLVFSDAWQSGVRSEEHNTAMSEIFREHLGEDLEEITRVKNWLKSHPKSEALYAYLLYNP